MGPYDKPVGIRVKQTPIRPIKRAGVTIEEPQRLVEVSGTNRLHAVPLFPKAPLPVDEDDSSPENEENPQHRFEDCCFAQRLVGINKRNKTQYDKVKARNEILQAQCEAMNEKLLKNVENEMNNHCEKYEITNLLARCNKHYLDARSLIQKLWIVVFALSFACVLLVIVILFKCNRG